MFRERSGNALRTLRGCSEEMHNCFVLAFLGTGIIPDRGPSEDAPRKSALTTCESLVSRLCGALSLAPSLTAHAMDQHALEELLHATETHTHADMVARNTASDS